MRTCKNKTCLVTFLIWLSIDSVSCNSTSRHISEAYNASSETISIFPLFRPQIPSITKDPKCAASSTFCENVDSYPYTHLKYILERNSSYKDIFSVEKIEEELVNRQSPSGSFICRSVSKTVFPKIGMNKNNKWKFIINQDNYLQGVLVETCYRPESPCDIIGDVPPGYTTFCRQKYLYSKLLSLSDRGDPTPDIFKIPSACCCAYRRNYSFLKHFGAPVSSKH